MACFSSTYAYIVSSTSTSVTVAWDASGTAVNYQVEYKEPTDVSWTLLATQTTTTATITGLTANTQYFFRVNTICSVGNCYSITLITSTSA